jgi:hypothetical protein
MNPMTNNAMPIAKKVFQALILPIFVAPIEKDSA